MSETITVYATEQARRKADEEKACGPSHSKGRKRKNCYSCEIQKEQTAIHNENFSKENEEL
ncbi:MAG: hypothetical protein FWC64_07020 [Treponema sp.]|nr:hypothetical protein [Treponema sp.]